MPHKAMGLGKPDLSDLHKWGCTVWVKINVGKLNAKTAEAQFVGYDTEKKVTVSIGWKNARYQLNGR
jgi:hypothetical protein